MLSAKKGERRTNTVSTIGAGRVAEIVNMIELRIVVPLHYRTDGITVELEGLEELLAKLGIAKV